MARKKKIPTKEALIAALKELDGNQAAAARRFGCHRSLIGKYANDDPEVRALIDDLQETFIDEAESKLYQHIREGNVAACIFFLKTRARHRGYSERLELIPLAQQQIEVELGVPSITEQNSHVETLNGNGAAVALLEQ